MFRAGYRNRCSSRTNQFSYYNGLILATAVVYRAPAFLSTDPHLLKVTDLEGI
jgi:hypothetical protein